MKADHKEQIIRKLQSIDDTSELAKKIADIVKTGDILLFTGEIGAGKTTFIQSFAKNLGIKELVTSPTFVIHRLHTSGRIPLSHVDLYRLNNDDDVECIGFEEYYDTSVTCIEWADRYSRFEPPYLELHFEYGMVESERTVTIVPHGNSWTERISNI